MDNIQISNGSLALPDFSSRIISISSKLARRKSQLAFLKIGLEWDLCSSIRPRIGKSFSDAEMETSKAQCLEECCTKLGI